MPISPKKRHIHTIYRHTSVRPANLASLLLRARVGISLDLRETGPPAKLMINPIVDRLVSEQPAQSLSTKTVIKTFPLKLDGLENLITCAFVLEKYASACWLAFIWGQPGLGLNLASCITVENISSLVHKVVQRSEPVTLMYG
jgi:hypothetical protein